MAIQDNKLIVAVKSSTQSFDLVLKDSSLHILVNSFSMKPKNIRIDRVLLADGYINHSPPLYECLISLVWEQPSSGNLDRLREELTVWLDSTGLPSENYQVLRVMECEQWLEGAPGTRKAGFVEKEGFKLWVFSVRSEEQTHESFTEKYRDGHTPRVREHSQTILDYRQNFVNLQKSTLKGEVNGIAEMGFSCIEDFTLNFYRSEEGKEIINKGAESFMDTAKAKMLSTSESTLDIC